MKLINSTLTIQVIFEVMKVYKEIKATYLENKSHVMENDQIKNLQQTFLRECHKNILDARDIGCLLEDSVVESFTYGVDGVYITLKEEFNNMKLYIHETDFGGAPMHLSCFGSYEPDETEMVKRIIRQLPNNATIFDVGANIGWYSVMLKKCFEDINVYSFEPAPENFVRLQNNFRLNNLNDAHLVNLGFYKKKGKLDFHFNPERTDASSIKNILGQNVEVIQVDMDTMDSWVTNNNLEGLDFIKCDVEGAELFVYQGGIESIKKYKPIIMSEMLRKWSAKFDYHPNDIIQLFKNIGYECYVIDGDNRLRRFDYVDEKTVETNYFFIHPEVHSKIISELCVIK